MKITDVSPRGGEDIESDEGHLVRCGPDNWFQWIGETLEPLYLCEAAEVAYQAYVGKKA